jgi:ribose 5-phosphate isomerase B
MGGRVVGKDLGLSIVRAFLASEFEGGRHETRVNLITAIEAKN